MAADTRPRRPRGRVHSHAGDKHACCGSAGKEEAKNGTRVLLVSGNPNVQSFVPPYGLELIAEALRRTGQSPVKIVDPFLKRPFTPSLEAIVKAFEPDIVGVGIRNLDSWFKPVSREAGIVGKSFIDDVKSLIDKLRNLAIPADRIILGGAAFSIAPLEILRRLGLVYGIRGPGECTFPLLVAALVEGRGVQQISGLVCADGARPAFSKGPTAEPDRIDLDYVPQQDGIHRKIALLKNEFVPLRTKSGCGYNCCYCCEAVTQPRPVRLRSLKSIEAELSAIRDCGLSRVFIADGEFNAVSTEHFEQVVGLLCKYQMSWRAYCLPVFSDRSVDLVGSSACEGVCLTIDSSSEKILEGIGRRFPPAEIERSIDGLLGAGINVQATLLFGLPGETRETIQATVRFVRTHQKVMFNYVCGVRVYPNTLLHRWVLDNGSLRVYGQKNGDFVGISLYSEPFPPWELQAYVAESLGGLPNIRSEFD